MEKMTVYLILSVGMGIGGWLPVLFGAGALSMWSFGGSIIGGIFAVVFIYRLNR